ncbi:MAG: hypothetical protein GTO51_11220 [Candidatus Latescibacteria bacterium]|nr:hypothetical protein [Candidatus Latescibacterota bacterium]NIM66534.1 hypothetical protein [Candidatus Latescibacterota bacterium]NIO03015.1 hypothetical protein [Candidatus Latescibacterota bacterium]NIO30151.1 hypothetical protein [Candidatus Latescibacterota bacterium]NIO57768.1 hypothetical protein [Candidatus Latescibacterota bacterium]
MRRLIIYLVVLPLLMTASCGDDPTEPEDSNPNYNGIFLISDTLDYSSCSITAPLGVSVDVTVVGTTITFAGFAGIRDPVDTRGYGATPETTVPIDPNNNCFGYYSITFDITYTDVDNFYGIYHVDYRYSPECQAPDCSYEYRIGGTRPL